MAKAEAGKTFVGVDLVREEVVAIAIYDDLIRDAYVLVGEFDRDGAILLEADETYNGERATEIALASQGIGLGWTFAKKPSAESRNLSDAWSR